MSLSKMFKDDEIHEKFLATLCNEEISVSIYLINGIKLQGVIVKFNSSAFILKGPLTQVVYRHAVSTVVPNEDPGMFDD